jgi:membrane fusion protein, multidrug efflux system
MFSAGQTQTRPRARMCEKVVLMKQFLSAGLLIVMAVVPTGCRPAGADASAGGGGPPPTQVVAVAASVQTVAENLSLVGTLAANESVELKSEIDGVVQEILFTEGARVQAGDLLVRLDDSKLSAAVVEAEANFKLSLANHQRAQQLLQDKLISQQEYDQAAATFSVNEAGLELKRRQLKDTRIHAPFAGTISARSISPGQVITRSTTLTWLIDLDPMKAEVTVPERFLGQVQQGQKLAFVVAAFPDRKFTGEVYFISPFVDPATRTALVKALIPNPDAMLKPGMFASMDLTLTLRKEAVVVPESALLQGAERTTVYVVDQENKAQIRPVRPGVRMAGVVEILEGVKAGETVIIEGLQKVRPGGQVAVVAPDAASPAPPARDGPR